MNADNRYDALSEWAESSDPGDIVGGDLSVGAAAADDGRQALLNARRGPVEVNLDVHGRSDFDPDADADVRSVRRDVSG